MLRQAAEAGRKRPRQELETDTPAQQARNGAGFYGWPCGAEGQCHHILRSNLNAERRFGGKEQARDGAPCPARGRAAAGALVDGDGVAAATQRPEHRDAALYAPALAGPAPRHRGEGGAAFFILATNSPQYLFTEPPTQARSESSRCRQTTDNPACQTITNAEQG